ncbi:MAG: hypothetical protein Q9209_005446 [Squamulea sp. 1 TL-2023]
MIFDHSIRVLYVLSLLIITVGYSAADDLSAELEPLWKPFPGQRDNGGCDADLQNLRDSYSQAISICKAAVAALKNLAEPKSDDPKEGQEWDRQARMAKAMFGIDTDPASGIPDKRMSRRQEIYNSILRLADSRSPPDQYTKRVYCTPRFMSYVRNGEKTPWGEAIGGSYPNGAFVWKQWGGWSASVYRIENANEDKDPETNLCAQGEGSVMLARTFPYIGMVVWCDDGLDGSPTFGKDAQEANSKIKDGDKTPLTMSSTWMHELIHVWSPEKVPDQPVARQDDQGQITRIEGVKSYDFAECANLARLVPDDAINNADNYQVFATVSGSHHTRET